jgi:hypothetical protein
MDPTVKNIENSEYQIVGNDLLWRLPKMIENEQYCIEIVFG